MHSVNIRVDLVQYISVNLQLVSVCPDVSVPHTPLSWTAKDLKEQIDLLFQRHAYFSVEES